MDARQYLNLLAMGAGAVEMHPPSARSGLGFLLCYPCDIYLCARLGVMGGEQDGVQILHEQERNQSKTLLLGLHEMQTSGDATTADLATGALSNLAQHDSWRARMQMLDMLNTFTMGTV
eukprot:7982252-Pyramimonas_sp.AAC.1